LLSAHSARVDDRHIVSKVSKSYRTINRQRIQFIINSQLLRLHAQSSDTICAAERPRKGLLSAHSARVDDRHIVSKVSKSYRTINRQRIQFIINSQLLRLHAQSSDTICAAERPRKGLLSAHSARVDDRHIVSKVSKSYRTINRQRIQFIINSQLLRLHAQSSDTICAAERPPKGLLLAQSARVDDRHIVSKVSKSYSTINRQRIQFIINSQLLRLHAQSSDTICAAERPPKGLLLAQSARVDDRHIVSKVSKSYSTINRQRIQFIINSQLLRLHAQSSDTICAAERPPKGLLLAQSARVDDRHIVSKVSKSYSTINRQRIQFIINSQLLRLHAQSSDTICAAERPRKGLLSAHSARVDDRHIVSKVSKSYSTINRHRIQFIIHSQLLRLHAQSSDTICAAERPRKGFLSAHSARVDDRHIVSKVSKSYRTINRQRIQFIINSQLLRLHAQSSDTICAAERPRKGLLLAQSARVDDRHIVSKVLSHPSNHQ